ncbi:MAG: amidophosphoribosyltransferase [Patescibacteria group bacterium]
MFKNLKKEHIMCGIIGYISKDKQASTYAYVGLLQLQHRGKEGAMIATMVSDQTYCLEGGRGELGMAFIVPNSRDLRAKLIADLQKENIGEDFQGEFPPPSIKAMAGNVALGHTRYGTAGQTTRYNLQPIPGKFNNNIFFIAHNGNLVNTRELCTTTKSPDGCSDTRVIADLISQSQAATFTNAILEVLPRLKGALSLVLMHDSKLYVARGSFGFHPLQIGKRDNDWIVASESCAFSALDAKLWRDVQPGELIVISSDGPSDPIQWAEPNLKIDIFEYIYFLRPDSVVQGVEAGAARRLMGKYLAQEHPLDVDIIMPVPDSGNEAALGYWTELFQNSAIINKPVLDPWALFRPHTVSRTFIEPIAEDRSRFIKLKFNPRSQVKGKRILLVDDSIVRGSTTKMLVTLLKRAGATEVSLVVTSSPYYFPDFYGIDTYRVKNEIIARGIPGDDTEVAAKIAEMLGLKDLGYLSLKKTIQAILDANPDSGLTKDSFYTGVFSGEYPAGVGDFASVLQN